MENMNVYSRKLFKSEIEVIEEWFLKTIEKFGDVNENEGDDTPKYPYRWTMSGVDLVGSGYSDDRTFTIVHSNQNSVWTFKLEGNVVEITTPVLTTVSGLYDFIFDELESLVNIIGVYEPWCDTHIVSSALHPGRIVWVGEKRLPAEIIKIYPEDGGFCEAKLLKSNVHWLESSLNDIIDSDTDEYKVVLNFDDYNKKWTVL